MTVTGKHEARVTQEGKKAIVEDRTDVLAMGCGFPSGMSKEPRAQASMLVLDPGVIVITFTEMLVHPGARHSDKSYPFPIPKPIRMWPDEPEASDVSVWAIDCEPVASDGNRPTTAKKPWPFI